jgi:hypothetical protein
MTGRQTPRVRVSLGFAEFDCDPAEITEAIGIQPDDVRRRGERRVVANGHEFSVPHNLWTVDSRAESEDPNVQIREILARLAGVQERIDPTWNPFFNVLWKSETLGAGSGPYFETDVIRGIAGIGAEIYLDLYALEGE